MTRYVCTNRASLERAVSLCLNDQLKGEERRQAFIRAVYDQLDQVIAEARQRSGMEPAYNAFVNDQAVTSPQGLQCGDKFTATFNYLREMAAFAIDTLRELSPVLSGEYRESHFAMAAGAEIDPAEIGADEETVVVSNDQPYSRILELGSRRVGVEGGIYQRALPLIKRRYQGVAEFAFDLVDIKGGYVLKRTTRRRHAGEPLTYPAIVISRVT